MVPKVHRERKSPSAAGMGSATYDCRAQIRDHLRAILAVLSNEAMRFSDLVVQVSNAVRNFEGAIVWYVMSVCAGWRYRAECQHARPVRYSKSA
jgi:hypothetical protein